MSRRPAWWLDVLRIYWPLNHLIAKLTRKPVIGRVLVFFTKPLFGKRHFNITYLPVNANIDPAASTILTTNIIEELIRRSSHRVIVKRCSCRDSKRCATYPIEDSCMLIGDDTRLVDPRIATHVSVEEALRHCNEKIASGLIPMTGRVRMDDLYYGVPNRGRMLTVCFCCPCCCTILNSARHFPDVIRTSLVRLSTLAVGVDPAKCKQCGTCVETCFMKAITLTAGGITRDDTLCIGCGRCSTACPEKAVSVSVANTGAAIDEIMGRISERVRVD